MVKISVLTACLIFYIIVHTQGFSFSGDSGQLSTEIATNTPVDCKKILHGFEPKKPEELTAKDVEDYVVKGICAPEDIRCINSEEIAHKVAGILSACRPINKEIPSKPIERPFLDRGLLR